MSHLSMLSSACTSRTNKHAPLCFSHLAPVKLANPITYATCQCCRLLAPAAPTSLPPLFQSCSPLSSLLTQSHAPPVNVVVCLHQPHQQACPLCFSHLAPVQLANPITCATCQCCRLLAPAAPTSMPPLFQSFSPCPAC